MDWDEATTLGTEAAGLIEDLTRTFEQITQGGYIVTPPSWRLTEIGSIRSMGKTKPLVTIELDGRLQIAKVFEPVSGIGPPGSVEESSRRLTYGSERSEVPRWIATIDDQTCDACRRRHGMPYADTMGGACTKSGEDGGCRCVVTPRPKGWDTSANPNKPGG